MWNQQVARPFIHCFIACKGGGIKRELSQGQNTSVNTSDTTSFLSSPPQTISGLIACYSYAYVQGQNTHREESAQKKGMTHWAQSSVQRLVLNYIWLSCQLT
jgi:hypothetical protein